MEKIKQSTLVSDENAYLSDILERVRGYLQLTDRNGIPRFDLISKVVGQTPYFVFDHPDLVQHFGDTACTDGHHVFFNADFLKSLLLEDSESKKLDPKLARSQSFLTVAVHEPFHIALLHCGNKRLSQFPDPIPNIAEDIKINSIIKYVYKIVPGDKTAKYAWGFTDEEFKVFGSMSEETIAKILYKIIKNQQAQNQQPQSGQPQSGQPQSGQPQSGQPQSGQPQNGQPQNGQPQNGQPQNGQPQNGQPQSGQPQSGQPQSGQPQSGQPQNGQPQNGQPQNGQPQNGQFQPSNLNGVPSLSKDLLNKIGNIQLDSSIKDIGKAISLKDTIDALNKAGLSKIAEEVLKLPKASDDKKIDAMNDKLKSRINNAIGELANERRLKSHGNAGAGGPCEAYAEELLTRKDESKIKLSTKMLDMVIGNGNDLQPSFELPHPYFALDPETFGLEDNLYLESLMPAKKKSGALVCISDTSSSVSNDELVKSITLCYDAVKNSNEDDGVSNIYFASADTSIRGEIIELNEDNIEEVTKNLPIYGRGGTEILKPLKEIMQWSKEKEMEITGIIYSTDLDVNPPQKHMLPEDMPPLIFLATNNLRINEFRRACESYAEVYDIDEENKIDFEEIAEQKQRSISRSTM